MSEKQLFKKLMQENLVFNRTNTSPDWKQGEKVWNGEANGQDIFYKVYKVHRLYTIKLTVS
jgi:hypothetical protein